MPPILPHLPECWDYRPLSPCWLHVLNWMPIFSVLSFYFSCFPLVLYVSSLWVTKIYDLLHWVSRWARLW
jgi:hypothetical protein